MEIERQFLVDIIPALPDTFDSILQGYVSLFPEIRIRSIRPMEGLEKFYLTVKRGEGLVRDEWETEISSREFSHLVECEPRRAPGSSRSAVTACRFLTATSRSTIATAGTSKALITSKWSSTQKKKQRPLNRRTGSAARLRRTRVSVTANLRAKTARIWPSSFSRARRSRGRPTISRRLG